MRPKPIWDRLNVELLATQFVAWLPSLFAAVLIIFFFWLLFRITRTALHHLLVSTGFEPAFIGMVIGVYRFAIISFGIVMAASQMGINVGAALAGLGVVGLTIGFAAKDSLSNIMAGFLIFWDKPFHVDQWVTVSGYYGRIAEITMRTTRLQTRDNKWVIIPNSTVIDQIMINHSTNGATRLQIPVGIGYEEDIAQARAVILRSVAEIDEIMKTPEPQVVLNDLGASTVDLLVFVWIEDAKNEKPVFFRTLESIKNTLDTARISMPSPQLDVTLKSVYPEFVETASRLTQAASTQSH